MNVSIWSISIYKYAAECPTVNEHSHFKRRLPVKLKRDIDALRFLAFQHDGADVSLKPESYQPSEHRQSNDMGL
jgi:hypothetical protein